MLREGKNPREISLELNIPMRNLRRWEERGVEVKAPIRRNRANEGVEARIVRELEKRYPLGDRLSMKHIRETAKAVNPSSDFKASVGWASGFVRRHQLRRLFQIGNIWQ